MRTHEKIRKLREAKNYTQEYMAEELNISSKTYGRLENGDSPIKLDQLVRLSELLDVSIEDLISSDPVSVYVGTQNNQASNYGPQGGTINNYSANNDEMAEVKSQIARLEAALEKVLKQLAEK